MAAFRESQYIAVFRAFAMAWKTLSVWVNLRAHVEQTFHDALLSDGVGTAIMSALLL
jgi:hypothetical protein